MKHNIPSNNLVILGFVILLIIHFFSSCMTARKHLDKAYKKDPVEVAEFTRDKFPCLETSSDTTIKIDTLYDFIQLECPEYDINEPKVPGKRDTIYKDKPPVNYLIPTTRPRGTRPVIVGLNKYPQTITVTQKIEDSAKLFILNNKVSVCEATNAELEAALKRTKKFNLWLIIALVISALINVIQFVRRR